MKKTVSCHSGASFNVRFSFLQSFCTPCCPEPHAHREGMFCTLWPWGDSYAWF